MDFFKRSSVFSCWIYSSSEISDSIELPGIRFMYRDGRFDLVKHSTLDQLLEQNRLASFKRSSGWAVVGRDPIRSAGDPSYAGPERRVV